MSCNPNNTGFKGVTSISDDLLLNILETNFKMFLDWSFLQIGGWFDAKITNNTTIYGNYNPPAKLLLVDDPSYNAGQVWQGIRKDWVWESGISYANSSPINISGIYLNNTFLPVGSGYVINYPDGRVVFDNAKPKTSNINVNHSYRFVQVYRSSDSPWFPTVQYPSLNNNDADIKKLSNGEWSIAGNHRIQLPAIVIESVPRSRSKPYELGSTGLWLEQDLAFYVLAENKNDRNKILDILRLQQDLTINLFDSNAVAANDKFPIDHNGDKKLDSLMYPQIIENFYWKKCTIKDMRLFEMDSITPDFYRGMASATMEVIAHC